MRIAISVETKDGLDSIVAHHFGRCPLFALIDVEEKDVAAVELIDNPFFSGHQPGQVPEFIKEMGADVMLSGGMGGRAIQFFQQFDIKIATGVDGTVYQALEMYLGGELTGSAPCKDSVEHGHGHEHKH